MRKQLFNQCRLTLTLSIPKNTRLIVAEKPEGEKKTGEQQVTLPVKANGRAYLPGSSLKGVLRSRAEFIANTLNDDVGACHLFDPQPREPVADLAELRRAPCGHRLALRVRHGERAGNPLPEPARYRDACPICRLFGHTLWAGRLRVSDFAAVGQSQEQKHPHIAVDRFTSGVDGGKFFQVSYLTDATFRGEITIDNFSLWQLGLLGLLLRDLKVGLITIGHKRTSGAGRVNIDDAALEFRTIVASTRLADGELWGISRYLDDAANHDYGYTDEPPPITNLPGLTWQRGMPWDKATLPRGSHDSLWNLLRPVAAKHLQSFRFAAEMQPAAVNELLAELQPARETIP